MSLYATVFHPPHTTEMTVLQGYKTIILDDGLYLLSFPLDKQMKFIHVLTLYMQGIYKGGLAAEPVLYCIYNMPDFHKKVKFSTNFFIWVRLSFFIS